MIVIGDRAEFGDSSALASALPASCSSSCSGIGSCCGEEGMITVAGGGALPSDPNEGPPGKTRCGSTRLLLSELAPLPGAGVLASPPSIDRCRRRARRAQ